MAAVLILGATSDIGVAIAKKFASEKFDVLLAARKPEQLKPLESDIHIRYGVNCKSLEFDALQYDTHAGFFDALDPKPSVSICVFGILDDEELAFDLAGRPVHHADVVIGRGGLEDHLPPQGCRNRHQR